VATGEGECVIEVICGGMFSGKTEELLRRIRRARIAKQKVQLFKPKIDTRYSINNIQSHEGMSEPSIPVLKAEDIVKELKENTQVIGIDEIQFFDSDMLDLVQKLANENKRIIVAGLDMMANATPFGIMPALLSIAEDITKLHAVCMRCGASASFTKYILPEGTPGVGGKEAYIACCRNCYNKKEVNYEAKNNG
jgi:thymidine kinase